MCYGKRIPSFPVADCATLLIVLLLLLIRSCYFIIMDSDLHHACVSLLDRHYAYTQSLTDPSANPLGQTTLELNFSVTAQYQTTSMKMKSFEYYQLLRDFILIKTS